MTQEIKESQPLEQLPDQKPPKGRNRWLLPMALTLGLGLGATIYGAIEAGRTGSQAFLPFVSGGQTQVEPTPTQTPEIVITPTPEPISTPESTPVPELTLQQKIELIRKVQQEALKNNTLQIPVIENTTVVTKFVEQTNTGIVQIAIPPNMDKYLPSLTDGTVTNARRSNSHTNIITVQTGNLQVIYTLPSTSELLVGKDDTIQIGIPIAKVQNNPDNPTQSGFESQGVGAPKGTVMKVWVINSGRVSVWGRNIERDAFITNSSGDRLSIRPN